MYDDKISKLIQTAPNLVTVRIFDLLLHKKIYDGGVIISKKFIADELNLNNMAVARAFKWLIENNFVTETSDNGLPKFILHYKSDDNVKQLTNDDLIIDKSVKNLQQNSGNSRRQYIPEE